MRFISIMTLNPTNRLPTEAEMASMHKLIVEGMKAGWLIECEGVTFGTTGVRVHKAASGLFSSCRHRHDPQPRTPATKSSISVLSPRLE